MDREPLRESNLSENVFEEEEEKKKLKTKKTHKLIIFGAFGIVAVIVIIILILIFTLKKDDDDKEKIKPRSLLDVEKLKKYQTPYYYYNTTLLNETIAEALRLANQHDISIHFSLKSNFNEKIVRIFASHKEIGADCVSGGEVNYSVNYFPKDKIVFAGIGKTDEEIADAVDKGIFCINVESYEELENLNEICKGKKRK